MRFPSSNPQNTQKKHKKKHKKKGCAEFTAGARISSLWWSNGGTGGRVHVDEYENLFTVLAGTKRVKLFHQRQRQRLYMKSRAHMYGGGSQSISPVDIDAVDLHRFPLAGTMRHHIYRPVL